MDSLLSEVRNSAKLAFAKWAAIGRIKNRVIPEEELEENFSKVVEELNLDEFFVESTEVSNSPQDKTNRRCLRCKCKLSRFQAELYDVKISNFSYKGDVFCSFDCQSCFYASDSE